MSILYNAGKDKIRDDLRIAIENDKRFVWTVYLYNAKLDRGSAVSMVPNGQLYSSMIFERMTPDKWLEPVEPEGSEDVRIELFKGAWCNPWWFLHQKLRASSLDYLVNSGYGPTDLYKKAAELKKASVYP